VAFGLFFDPYVAYQAAPSLFMMELRRCIESYSLKKNFPNVGALIV
jgi:hypothetical protein